MNAERGLHLALWDCRGLETEDDVVDLALIVREVGLLPAGGYSGDETFPLEPVADVEGCVRAQHWDMAARYPEARATHLQTIHDWGFALVRPATPETSSAMRVEIKHPSIWAVHVVAYEWPQPEGETIEAFGDAWGSLFEACGMRIYQRARPVLAAISTMGDPDEDIWRSPNYSKAVPRRDLIVGWRTWFGPPYADKFGREWLINLPDRATELDDGGIFHALSAPASAVSRGDWSAFDAVESYLEQHKVDTRWPRFRARRCRRG